MALRTIHALRTQAFVLARMDTVVKNAIYAWKNSLDFLIVKVKK